MYVCVFCCDSDLVLLNAEKTLCFFTSGNILCAAVFAYFLFCVNYEVMCFVLFDCRDLQSYLSDLSLFLAPESKKFYILVDNRPWLGSRSAHLWQLMVTKVTH